MLFVSNNPLDIAEVNKLKREAEDAYQSGDYQTAISNYRYLIDSLDIREDQILLNLAHAYYQSDDTTNAKNFYSEASMSGNQALKSIAYQQLGVMSKSPQSLKQSLQYLKASLKANSQNLDARYDYELVKKLIQEQEQQQNEDQKNQDKNDESEENQENEDQQHQEDQDQENQDQQNQDQNQQDQEKEEQENQEKEGEQQEQENQQSEEQKEDQSQEMSTKEKLEQMNISEEKARMILEAMRNGEIQYLQQQKRKATKRPDSGKPDW